MTFRRTPRLYDEKRGTERAAPIVFSESPVSPVNIKEREMLSGAKCVHPPIAQELELLKMIHKFQYRRNDETEGLDNEEQLP